jgi:hypothetical protein
MLARRNVLIAGAVLLAGCGRPESPLARLEKAVTALQAALEAKDTSEVMQQLDARFRAQDELDADWARKTMTLMFLRYAQVRIVAASTRSTLEDGEQGVLGRTEAQVLVTGAQGLIPERMAPYTVTLHWRREGDDWKLRDLYWE